MNKIREEAEYIIEDSEQFGPEAYLPIIEAAQQAKRVLLINRAYRYRGAAMKLRNYFENDAAWAMSNGVARGDGWYWFCIDCCEHNANVLWTKAADLYKQAEDA